MSRSAVFSGSLFGIALGAIALMAASPKASLEEREKTRLRAHFDSVLVELRTRDVSSLSMDQRAARRVHIARLQEYRDAGVFPRNIVSRDPTPVFVDPDGVQCAMGYLIARSGRTDIVDRISATRNLARIPELADDPALVAWLDSAGLTVAEAARIQPAYEGGPCLCPRRDDMTPPRWTTTESGYVVSSAVHIGVASALITANLVRPGRTRWSLAATAVGAAGIGLAASQMSNANAPRSLAVINGAFAAATIGSAWRSVRVARRMTTVPLRPDGSAQSASRVTPYVSPSSVGLSMTF